MSLHDFLEKQFIKVIQWTESDQDTLAWRFPMQDMEIMNGGQLTVRDSQAAAFVNEGRIADVFAPGLYTLNTRTLPILTDLMNWSKEFKSPFKSDVYFFSTRIKTDQRWGTATPITIRDKEFGAVRVRGYGIYSWHIDNPRVVLHQGQRHARDVQDGRSRRPASQHHRRSHDRTRSPKAACRFSTWPRIRWSSATRSRKD